MDDILTATAGATGNKPVTASATGRWVAHQVSFLADDVNPASTTAFPAASASYNAAGWAAGCAPDGICGTATDADSAVQTVQVSIRQGAGNYWNGTTFGSATEVWNAATGTTTWNYGFASGSFPANGSYTVRVRATDVAGNIETPVSATFTYDTVAPALPTGLASSPVSPANDNNPEITGTRRGGLDRPRLPHGGLYRRRLGDRDCSRLRLARSDGRGHRRHLHDLQGDGDGRSRQRQRLLDRVCHLRRGLDRARTAERARLEPGLACERQQPGDHRNCGGGLDGPALSHGGLHGRGLRDRDCGGLRFARPHGSGLRRHFDDFQGDCDRRGRQRLAAARALRSRMWRTRPRRRCRARSPRAPSRPRTTTTPRSRARPRPARRFASTPTAGCTGGAAATGTAAAFASPGLTVAVAGDSSTTLQGNRDRRGRQRLRLLELLGHLCRGLDGARAPERSRFEPGLAGERQQPARSRAPPRPARRSRVYTTRDCTGGAAATGTAAAFARPGSTVAVADDSSTTFTRDRDRRGRQRLRLLELLGHLRRGLDRAGRARARSPPSPASPANDNNPEITGSAEAGSTVAALHRRRTAPAPPRRPAPRPPSRRPASRSRSPTTLDHDLHAPPRPTRPATSPACSSAGHLRRGLDGAGRSRRSLDLEPGLARERQQPGDQGLGRGGLDRADLHDRRLHRRRRPRPAPPPPSPRPGLTVAVADDTTRRPSRRRRPTRPATSAGCSSALGHLRRGLDRARRADARLAPTPASPGQRQQPRDQGHRRGGLDGAPLHDDATAPAAPRRPARRLPSPRRASRSRSPTTLDHRPSRATATDAAGNVERLLDAPRSPTSRTRPRPALPTLIDSEPGLAGQRQQPRGQGLAPRPARRCASTRQRLHRRRRGDRHRGRASPRRASPSRSPTTRPPPSRAPPPTPPATSPPARAPRSPTSRTRPRRRSRASPPPTPASPGERQQPRGQRHAPRPARPCASTRRRDCTAAPRRPALRPPSRRRASRSPSPTTRLDDLQATATDAAGNVSRLLELLGHLRRGLDRAGASRASLASSPVSPANDNNPEITGTAEAGSTVRVYTTAACTGGAAATGTAAAFAEPGPDDRGRRRHDHDLQGDGHGRRRQRLAAALELRHLRRGLDGAGAPRARSLRARLGPANDNNPEITGSAEAGSTVRVYPTAAAPAAPRRPAARPPLPRLA